MVICSDACALPAWGGDDLQRFGGYRATDVRALLRVRVAPGGVVACGPRGNVWVDEAGLPPFARACRSVHRALRSCSAACRNVFSGQISCDSSLDQDRAD